MSDRASQSGAKFANAGREQSPYRWWGNFLRFAFARHWSVLDVEGEPRDGSTVEAVLAAAHGTWSGEPISATPARLSQCTHPHHARDGSLLEWARKAACEFRDATSSSPRCFLHRNIVATPRPEDTRATSSQH